MAMKWVISRHDKIRLNEWKNIFTAYDMTYAASPLGSGASLTE